MENLNFEMLFRIFTKRLWAIVLAFVVAVSAAYAYCTYIVTPRYSATASVLVTNGAITEESPTEIKRNVQSTDISASLSLVDTITDILKTPEIYRAAAKKSEGKYTHDKLQGAASVARRNENTLFIDISFRDANGADAIEMANIFASAACDYIKNVIPNSSATVVAKAVSAKLTYPRTVSTMMTSGIFAMVIVYVLFLIPEMVNRVIRNEEDFVKNFDLPIIGSIPSFDATDSESYAYTSYRKGK